MWPVGNSRYKEIVIYLQLILLTSGEAQFYPAEDLISSFMETGELQLICLSGVC